MLGENGLTFLQAPNALTSTESDHRAYPLALYHGHPGREIEGLLGLPQVSDYTQRGTIHRG